MASKNFKFSCLYGRPCRAETRFGSTLTKDFSIPVDCQRQKPACKHALKAKISSEGTKKAGRLERQLVKKKAVTHLRAGGSSWIINVWVFVVDKLYRSKTRYFDLDISSRGNQVTIVCLAGLSYIPGGTLTVRYRRSPVYLEGKTGQDETEEANRKN